MRGTKAPTTLPGALLLRWPTWLGIGLAVLIGLDLSSGADGVDTAPALAAMAFIYLAATVLRRPPAAWPLFPAMVIVIRASEALVGDGDATWVILGLAVPVLAHALWSSTRRPDRNVRASAIAMVAFGAVAALALGVSEEVGAYLVAAGLAAHALWDGYHHWRNTAVVRSYAECCFALDLGMAVAVVVTV